LLRVKQRTTAPAPSQEKQVPATPAESTTARPPGDSNINQEDEEAEIDIDAMLSEDEEDQSSFATTMMTPAEKVSLLADVVHVVANNPGFFHVTSSLTLSLSQDPDNLTLPKQQQKAPATPKKATIATTTTTTTTTSSVALPATPAAPAKPQKTYYRDILVEEVFQQVRALSIFAFNDRPEEVLSSRLNGKARLASSNFLFPIQSIDAIIYRQV